MGSDLLLFYVGQQRSNTQRTALYHVIPARCETMDSGSAGGDDAFPGCPVGLESQVSGMATRVAKCQSGDSLDANEPCDIASRKYGHRLRRRDGWLHCVSDSPRCHRERADVVAG